jgi:hypothetical protein
VRTPQVRQALLGCFKPSRIMRITYKHVVSFFGMFIILIVILRNCSSEIFDIKPNDILCDTYRQESFTVINGIVDSVYEDKKNHSQDMLKVKNGKDIQTIYLEYDRSGLFEYLNSGDSVIKEYKSYEVVVKRSNSVKVFVLDYGCKETINF